MLFKILKKDFIRNKTATFSIFAFSILSTILIVLGIRMFVVLNISINNLMKKSLTPHFSQYHSGDIDDINIKHWVESSSEIELFQIQKILNIDTSKIYLNNHHHTAESVIEPLFVKQNAKFDFLLGLNNKKLKLHSNEIAIPIHYKQKENLDIGDEVIIKFKTSDFKFVIKEFVRDSQMNPSIVSSKRFVISDEYFKFLEEHVDNIEYLISFRLFEPENVGKFSRDYLKSQLPQNGPSVDYKLIKILNLLTDGLVAIVLVFISLLINFITLLSLYLLINLTLEEDYNEIAIMKSLGISSKHIKMIYVSKYAIILLIGAVIGNLTSFYFDKIFLKNISLYLGKETINFHTAILIILISVISNSFVFLFCLNIVKKTDLISPIEILKTSKWTESSSKFKRFCLNKRKHLNINIFFALKDILIKYKQYLSIFVVFSTSILIIVIPLNFLNTISSDNFITYMGIGKSDLIFILRQANGLNNDNFQKITKELRVDENILRFKSASTYKCDILNLNGERENIFVESSKSNEFALNFLSGEMPKEENEIAISYLISKELQKSIGKKIDLIINDKQQSFLVSGIYQDITNGGKTGKILTSLNKDKALWHTINVDSKANNLNFIKEKYEKKYSELKIFQSAEYFSETFSYTVNQLKILIYISSSLIVIIISIITSLFFKVIVAKDEYQIIIKKSIGISTQSIKQEYLFKLLTIFITSIVVGSIISNIFGEKVLSFILSIFGAPRIELEIDWIKTLFITPSLLTALVSFITIFNLRNITKINFKALNQE